MPEKEDDSRWKKDGPEGKKMYHSDFHELNGDKSNLACLPLLYEMIDRLNREWPVIEKLELKHQTLVNNPNKI